MRLRRLDLTRYGKFTDHSIDFGECVPGEPDLHIVYGPNEAGKSTALAAFLDLLFGIGAQSPFDFLHPYSTMRVGGALDIDGETRDFRRIKRAQNSLLDAEDRPLAESAIRAGLGGIERDAYRTMFSLDDETLEKGGESILASKGDLGRLLFSASTGLAHLSQKLIDLRSEADGFYRYRARGGALVDLKARLAELKSERERLDTLASDHARLVEARDRAASRYDEGIAERTLIQTRLDEIRHHLAALPRLTALRELRARLAPLAATPEAPQHWVGQLPGLQREEIALGVQVKANAEEIERLTQELGAVVVDEAALHLVDRMERHGDQRARHVTAEMDVPNKRLELRELDLSIAGILERLGRAGEPEPRRLLLKAATAGRLRALIEARSGVDAAVRNATKELGEAKDRLAEIVSRLPDATLAASEARERDDAMAALAATVTAMRSADNQARRRHAERIRAEAREELADRLAALRPWQGEADELVGMACPTPDMLQRWRSERSALEVAQAGHRAEIERLTTRTRQLEAEHTSLASLTGVVTDQEAAAIRARREQAWAAHRRALDASSADHFELVLRQDDIVGAARFTHMTELAKLHQNRHALAMAEAELARAAELADRAAGALHALDMAVADAARAMSPCFAPAPALPVLEDWLSRRKSALEAREALRSAERDLRAIVAEAAAETDRLCAAVGRAGLAIAPDAGFDAVLSAAQEALDGEAELRRLRAERDERQRHLGLRERAAAEAAAALRDWTEAWETTCRSCWLGEDAAVPDVGAVREVLAAIADLAPALEKRAGLLDRIAKMEADQAAFRDEVAALAASLGLADAAAPALELAQRIGEAVRQAGAAAAQRATLRARLAEAEARRRELAEASAILAQRKQPMMRLFAVSSLAEIAEKLSGNVLRAELRQAAATAEAEILEALRTVDLASAERILESADRAALEAELIALQSRFDDQDRRCQELFAERSGAIDRVAAIGADEAVADIEEKRRTTLLEIEDGAMRYLALRAGVAATERALASYRERHRSAMMARASEAFRTMSRGAYAGLAAQPGKDGETLIALARGGGSKVASELSKGTRFQLYLALRVAGYHEFAAARSAMPFIADDIMETFDDFRAEEAFRLFADMARAGQVIYLTHHQHLCDIARKVCPAVRLHRLDGAGAAP
ncbi:hypothetical protein BN1110_01342 [bacterium YEK0313]|nr:hypothetical protein BN1110_01342 [bacterium YEK0313]